MDVRATTSVCHLSQCWNVDFNVEVTRVAHQCAALHVFKVMLVDYVDVACCRHKDIANLDRLLHWHDAETVHNGF